MAQLTRRVFLVQGVLGAVLSILSVACTFLKQRAILSPNEERAAELSSTEVKAIEACLDLLIPEDETPAATTVGVDIQLRDEAEANFQIRATLREGVYWLTYKAMERGAKDFPSLGKTEQIALLHLAERAGIGSREQRFFSLLRNRAFYYYYASPGAFSFPGYLSSPQPIGYPDYSKPLSKQP